MIASILVCEYIKHGMTCELGGGGLFDLILLMALITVCALCVIGAGAARKR